MRSGWFLLCVGTGVTLIASAGAAVVLLALILGPCYIGALPLPDDPLCVDRHWGSHVIPIALFVITGFGLALGLVRGWSTARQQFGGAARLGRELLRSSAPAGPELTVTAREAGLTWPLIRCATDVPLAVTVGCRHPTVIVSDGLIARLGSAEMQAVLRHEAWHCRARDPLRIGMVRTAAQLGGCLPVLREMAAYAVLTAELQADRSACDWHGSRLALVGALRSLLTADACTPARAVSGIASSLPERIAALGGQPTPFRPSPRALCLSAMGVMLAAWTMATAARLLLT